MEIFHEFKVQMKAIKEEIEPEMRKIDKNVELSFHEFGDFESELKFSGDTLVFMMHTNVFTFPPEHEVSKSSYVTDEPLNAYCGMIMIYNFLSDSIKYNRMDDSGYLIARVFINKEGHFFVDGKRQFSFLYNDFSAYVINTEIVKQIIQTAILHTLDFDLFAPPIDEVNEITLGQKVMATGFAALKTGKRMGFDYLDES